MADQTISIKATIEDEISSKMLTINSNFKKTFNSIQTQSSNVSTQVKFDWDKASEAFKKAGGSFEDMGKKAGGASSFISNFGRELFLLTPIAMGAAGAAMFLKDSFTEAIKLANDSVIVTQRLSTTMQNLGLSYRDSEKEINSVTEALMKKTAVDDEAQKEALVRLITITGDYNKSLKMLPDVINLARYAQTDLSGAAEIYANILEGNIERLPTSIRFLKEYKDAGYDTAEMLEVLNKRTKDLGENSKTSLSTAKVAWDEFLEGAGTRLLSFADLAIGVSKIASAAITHNGKAGMEAAKQLRKDMFGLNKEEMEEQKRIEKQKADIILSEKKQLADRIAKNKEEQDKKESDKSKKPTMKTREDNLKETGFDRGEFAYQEKLKLDAFRDNQKKERALSKEAEEWQDKLLDRKIAREERAAQRIAKAQANEDGKRALRDSADYAIASLEYMASKDKEFAGLYKAAAITKTIIDTRTAAMGIFKNISGALFLGPAALPLAIAGAGATIAFGATQIAAIQSQKFASGGIVGGNSYSGDNINASLNSGEMVLNQIQQAKLFQAANGGGGSNLNISFNLSGGATIDKGAAREIVNRLERMARDGHFDRSHYFKKAMSA